MIESKLRGANSGFMGGVFATPYSFTSTGRRGAFGPNASELQAFYSATQYGLVTSVGDGYQRIVIDVDGVYQFQVRSASGEINSQVFRAGRSGEITASFSLSAGNHVVMAVGQLGNSQNYGSGGGGASYIYTSAALLMVVGGGGGYHPNHTTTGPSTDSQSSQSGGLGFGTSANTRSSGGSGGFGQNNNSYGSFSGGGGVGGGWLTEGSTNSAFPYAHGASLSGGGVGGSHSGNPSRSTTNTAGYGGGGAFTNTYGGGGGGYSGGHGSYNGPHAGGGGGSIVDSSGTVIAAHSVIGSYTSETTGFITVTQIA